MRRSRTEFCRVVLWVYGIFLWHYSFAIAAPLPISRPSPSPSGGVLVVTETPLKEGEVRDPFAKPEILLAQLRVETAKSELEYFAVEDYKLIGIMTGPKKLRAMVVNPNGKTFFVAERSRIGLFGGEIIRIETDRLVVKEKKPSPTGTVKVETVELLLEGHGEGVF